MPETAPKFATARLIAIVTGIIGAVLAIATPLLPVQQDVATLSWPQSSFGSVNAPLVSYSPVDLEATIPCSAATALTDGGTLISTAPIEAAKTEQKALIVRVDDDRLQVLLRDRVLAEAPVSELSADCAVTVSSNATSTVVDLDGDTSTMDGDVRPQVVGIYTDLTAPVDGLNVRADIDSRYSSSPTTFKLLAMIVGALAVIASLFALHRLDSMDGRRHRRFLPSRWKSITGVDAVVVGVLVLWHFIGANTSDDGYLLNMARVSENAGYMANYFRWFGVPEAPFGMPYYDMLAALAKVSTASIWMRLPATIAALLCWLVISREVIPRLGRAVLTNRVALWTAGFVFLAFWLPYDNGLRPEPIIALGALLTWCSIERAIATGRLLPAAIGTLIAAFSLAAGPTGLIAVAALLAGLRPLVMIVVKRARQVGLLAVLAPLIASGLAVLIAIFADQTLATVLEATRVRSAIGPNVPWFEERVRWDALMTISPDGSLARRFGMFAMLLCIVVCIAVMLRKNGRIPGTATGPSRRILGIILGALALMMFTPTKWTHHFGVYAGLAASLAALAAVAVTAATVRSPRNRTLFTAAVLFLTAVAFTSSNGWWYVSSYGIPWFDKPPSIAGKGFSTILLGLTVLTLLYAAYQHVRLPYRREEPTTRRRFAPSALTIVAGGVVAFEVLSFVKGAVAQYPAYSIARSNFSALAGNSCGLAGDVQVETDVNGSVLQPTDPAADALGAGGSTGFTPDGVAQDLTADSEDTAQGSANSIRPEDSEQSAAATSSNSAGTSGGTTENVGINGSTVALPFGLDPSTTPVLGSFGATEPASLTSGWYALPGEGDLIAIAAAGRIRSVDEDGIVTEGQRVELEYGRRDGGDVIALGRITPLDIGPSPSWRNLRVPMNDLPADADVVRIVAEDNDLAGDQWLAVTPPRVPKTQTLNSLVGSTDPVMLDWAVGLAFPCQRPFDHRDGVAEVPKYRILPDRTGAESTNAWQDSIGGGPLGWTELLLGAETLPSYLADDYARDWGSIERYTPLDPDATTAEIAVEQQSRSGLASDGPMKTD
ncbi:arabinosyltransferase domain-containing protein [Rhodococcus sp. IEGM 1401]|uniref:arabinosyltransferase domain-containing protein n=1 Tax=unclassified Rhodococcus (in: high G+C Gram-positive bacteria) TaxID=192944 RepID=UPI0022B58A73|nr:MULTISPECIES: arabinosyltransferase domain-containing protein [unclassified Rhodococcus (in: high G+C Gram-positive bacteria)]MCZ4564163.1 arabinosyltransferase domain-containing protein [Rhodococcus sp. IEGM 1401]MDI9924293.1 arabinosyltransferase domain-containing protein [Rhodococcus sp. IEGM 1372]MDV8036730.1 arabinosyltransferase domain-containing protein [Rhodococcus sp. IEGM 1414]